MVPFESLLLFTVTATLLALTPGPDNLYVASYSLRYGYRPGLVITLGLCSGLLVHTSAALLGLSLLISESPLLFSAVRYAGGCYLLYLAWRLIRPTVTHQLYDARPLSYRRLYRRGILMNLSNPKVILFFIAFLPQFVSGKQLPAELLSLGVLFIIVTLLVFSAIAVVAGRLGDAFVATERGGRRIGQLTALLLTVLAINLLVAD